MSKPHFPWNPCRSQNVPNKRCKPWVLCERNLCSQIIKWYLIDTQWPLFVDIVSKDRTLPQPFFWRVVGEPGLFDWLLFALFRKQCFESRMFILPPNNVFQQIHHYVSVRGQFFSVPRAYWLFFHELQAGIFNTHMHKNPECPSDTRTVNKSTKKYKGFYWHEGWRTTTHRLGMGCVELRLRLLKHPQFDFSGLLDLSEGHSRMVWLQNDPWWPQLSRLHPSIVFLRTAPSMGKIRQTNPAIWGSRFFGADEYRWWASRHPLSMDFVLFDEREIHR